ncbi:hypothetical protein [Chelatococcus sp. CO-6]|uniref:hypothetical protein n=1 Tax=Chelatococcus sp. CO-6 TaxID=1702325 RepID=UPI000B09B510|nr:hypothetical protein [Chelatococcus sp. CO-6]
MQTRDPSALASAFRQIRPAFVAAGTLSLFMNLLMFVSPIYTLQIYDRVLTSRSGMTLVMISCIALVLLVSFAALEHFRSRILLHAGVQFDRLLAGESFEAALASASQTRGVHHVHILRDLDTLRDVFSGAWSRHSWTRRGRRSFSACASFCIRSSAWWRWSAASPYWPWPS